MDMRTEIWNGYSIRFVYKSGEWWAVLKDVCCALGLKAKRVSERLSGEVVSTDLIPDVTGRKQEMLIVDEFGIYDTVFQSRKKAAKDFRLWVYAMLKELRRASGLEGFEIFRMLDKGHQVAMMEKLRTGMREAKKVDYIKANTIANKAVSIKHGLPRMIKKRDMSPDMLIERQAILEDTVALMGVQDRFGLDLSVSDHVYNLVREA